MLVEPTTTTRTRGQVNALDQRIDKLVNEIYKVSDEELHPASSEPVDALAPKPTLRLVRRRR